MTISQADKAKAFLDLHQPGNPFVMPNPWDQGSAKVLAGLGFKALGTSSSAMAFTLGKRDYKVTREDAIAHGRAIVEATDLPVSADLENGFSDAPAECDHIVQMAAEAGLAGCSIEDYSGHADEPIYSFGAAVERVEAAVASARRLPFHFVITARAENFGHGRPDLDDTIARLKAFSEVGADVLYAPYIFDPEQMKKLVDAVDKPVNALAHPKVTVQQWANAGVARISLGSWLARAAHVAFLEAAETIAAEGAFTGLPNPKRFGDIDRHL